MAFEENKNLNDSYYSVADDPRLDVPEGEKPDFLEFLVSQPEVDVELCSVPEEVPEEPMVEKTEEEEKVEALAERIRACSKMPQIISFSVLLAEDEGVVEVFENLFKDENYKDILHIKGEKDTYYYSHPTMAHSFANIAVNVVEGNDSRTMAHSIRVQANYPLLTPQDFFEGFPFYLSNEQIEQVRMAFKVDPNYNDIKEIEFNDVLFFYSTNGIREEAAPAYAQEVFMTKWGMSDKDGNIILD